MWGYKISWDNPIGRWALRIQGHGWATVSRDPKVLVRASTHTHTCASASAPAAPHV